MENNIYNSYPYYLELKKEKEDYDDDLIKDPYNAVYEFNIAKNKRDELTELLEYVLKNCFFPSEEFNQNISTIKGFKKIKTWILSADYIINEIENLKKTKGIVIYNPNNVFYNICSHLQMKISYYMLNYLDDKDTNYETVLLKFVSNFTRRIKAHSSYFDTYNYYILKNSDDIYEVFENEKNNIYRVLNKIFTPEYKAKTDSVIFPSLYKLFALEILFTGDQTKARKNVNAKFKGETKFLINQLPIYYNNDITKNDFCKKLFPLIKNICRDKDLYDEDQYLHKRRNDDVANKNNYKRYMVKSVKNNMQIVKTL